MDQGKASTPAQDGAGMSSVCFNLFPVGLLLLVLLIPSMAFAQGETTTAIIGQVIDASGSAVPGATVTIMSLTTGLQRTLKTDEEGRFNFPQLPPGAYSVKVEAEGFDPQENDSVNSGLGQKQEVNFTLQVAHSKQTIEVSAEAPLIDTANANTSSALSGSVLADIPNPGGDLTYPLQFASGALINTAGSSSDAVGGANGYGNVEFNGLPAASNGYIVDGLETNDPFTNLNIGLSTNLVLGMNSISDVTVNTLSYSVDQGRYGASQIDYVTKSGANQFHGDAYEIWNGSSMNAADYFTNATPGNLKPQSNVNHFGGSLGGPILHDKLFFFSDFEWVRLTLPIVMQTTVPTTALQQYVLHQLPLGGVDAITGSAYPASPQSLSFYQKMFSLYGNTGGTPLPVLGCPFNTDGSPAGGTPPNGNGCANRQLVSRSTKDSEQVQTVRIDYNRDPNNTAWFRFQADTGLQAQYTDPINPLFNCFSPQPQYTFGAGYTHVFSQNLVNYFNPGFTWYSSLFEPSNYQQTLAAFPIVLQGQGANAPFSNIGGDDNTWVQGRRATRFFVNDNLAWTRGPHELRFGTNIRILRLNDYDFGEGNVPTVTYTDLPQFIYGVASTALETFPAVQNEPFNFLNVGFYAQDTWKVAAKVTWTFGLRDTFNSNPLNPHAEVARLSGSFASISHNVNQPLDAAVQTGLGNLFSSVPFAILEPRTAVAWQFSHNSVLRTGFGIFSDLLPGSVADAIGMNPPYVQTFQGGLLGTAGGLAIAPGVPNSAVGAVVAAHQAFNSGFVQGDLSCASLQANPPACLQPVAMSAVPDGKLHPPYFLEWSFGIEHQFGDTASVRTQYVGTRAISMPYLMQVNGYQNVCQGCFAPFPYQQPADPRFGAVTQFSTGANSHYNGVQLTLMKRLAHGLEGTVNYNFSRCMDTVSNGGFLPFSAGGLISPLPGDLARDYGPCDYDIRHNFNAQYIYQLPVKVRNRELGYALNGWQLAGTFFWHSGIPFSVLSTPYSANGDGIVQGGGPQFASAVPGVPLYQRTPVPGATQPGTLQWLNPNAFISAVDPSTGACAAGDTPQNCQFGDLGRNALRGPDFFWSDLNVTKSFSLTERIKFRIEGQFFNVFNHPNFGLPSIVLAGIPGKPSTQTGFGALTYTVSPPTGLLGVGLGADSSVRMIALHARVEF
jgi:Carboxypeptidase regulatory-like domain